MNTIKLCALLLILALSGCDDNEPSATGAYTPAKPDPCEKSAPINPCK